jgi:serine/threonine protein kinase
MLALEDLHKRDIIFRDLKPDNLVFDHEGHCMITDFGLSRGGINMSDSAMSFCGSPAYLAPEMLRRQGHGKAVDWYLIGVLLYEMLIGIPPYYSNNKDVLYQNIQYGTLQMPKYVSTEARSLIIAVSHSVL